MHFRVKDMDIATGAVLICLLHENDAKTLDVHQGDRVLLRYKRRKTVAILDIAVNGGPVKPGQIGLFEEVLKKLHVKPKGLIRVDYARKPDSLQFIKKKLEGGTLTPQEINTIVKDIVRDELTEGELTYFVSACYSQEMSAKETVALTEAIVANGETVKLRRSVILDKHCIGGIPGNRTTMIVVPIIAAAGYTMPKTSSRSITSAAGTADTMEVLAPVALTVKKMERIAKKNRGLHLLGRGG